MATNRASLKGERLEARVTRSQKRLIERAAAIRGTSVTEFVIASSQEAANRAIDEMNTLSLRNEARKVFVAAILNPPSPNAAARAAAKRYLKQAAQ